MKKLYLLPISMILMTTGYADEPQQTQSEEIVQEEIVQNPDSDKTVARESPNRAKTDPQVPTRQNPTSAKPSDTHGNQGDKPVQKYRKQTPPR